MGQVVGLRQANGTFAGPGGRYTKRFDLRYFAAAKRAITPEQFEKLCAEVLAIAMDADEACDRVAAAKAILQVFLPKHWHEHFASYMDDPQVLESRPKAELLDAVERIVKRHAPAAVAGAAPVEAPPAPAEPVPKPRPRRSRRRTKPGA